MVSEKTDPLPQSGKNIYISPLAPFPKGSQQRKKVTKLRTLSVPPLAPPASMDTYGGLFSKSAYRRLATFGEKARMLPFLEGTYPFH